jgi:hypothetical protein
VDPSTGRPERQVATARHFSDLVPNGAGSELYGITSEVPGTQAPAELVRIDAHSGNVLQARLLDSDYWWIAVAPLKAIPSGDVSVTLPADDDH